MSAKRKAARKSKPGESGIDPLLVKALNHPIRVQALRILNERVTSPNQLAIEMGLEVSDLAYHIRKLVKFKCIELVDTEQRRGATEHFYRATARAFIKADEWFQIPPSMRTSISASVVRSVVDDAAEALTKGTFDKREDRHLSWTPMILDDEGWAEVVEELAGSLSRVIEIQGRAADRLAKADQAGDSFTISVMGYQAPAKPRKVAPAKTP